MTNFTKTIISYGAVAQITAPLSIREQVELNLPPVYSEVVDVDVESESDLQIIDDEDGYELLKGGKSEGPPTDLDSLLDRFDARLRACISLNADPYVFVHAGAVAVNGQAIVIPGSSFKGKSTLIHELCVQGAEYLSDEYAVVDSKGNVYPYPRRLSIRKSEGIEAAEVDPVSAGFVIAKNSVPIGVIAALEYQQEIGWNVEPIKPALGALKLLANTVPARTRPADCLRFLGAASAAAHSFEGTRGEASAAAELLIDSLTSGSFTDFKND